MSDVIKVMIVDDSTVVRKFISSALEGQKEFLVVGEASNGKEALDVFQKCEPDIITLDVEMPIMDGIETLSHIRRKNKKVPVVMFSTLTERGAKVTLEALSCGANDYIAKPSTLGGKKNAVDDTVTEIRLKLRLHANRGRNQSTKPTNSSLVGVNENKPIETLIKPITAPTNLAHATPNQNYITPIADNKYRDLKRTQSFKALGIGVSTGGPNAMAELFKDLTTPLPVPVFITQHMPPVFTKMFAERLKSISGLNVYEAENGQDVKNGDVYIAPGGFHMEVLNSPSGNGVVIGLNQNPPENSCRPAVDVMFRSLARVYKSNVLGLILTGMGSDGLSGSEVLVKAGGEILAQDEDSSAVWGMPGAVTQAGLVSMVLPLNSIASELKKKLGVR